MTKMTIPLSSLRGLLEALAENDLSIPVSRSQFIRGKLKQRKPAIRPPWSLPEEDFLKHCDGCSECISSCPNQILEKDTDGYPVINFSQGECSFCGNCTNICPTGALASPATSESPWKLEIQFASNCLALNSTVCQTCGDQCISDAIIFKIKLGGITEPHFIHEKCNGCGACLGSCPVNAIEIRQSDNQEQP